MIGNEGAGTSVFVSKTDFLFVVTLCTNFCCDTMYQLFSENKE